MNSKLTKNTKGFILGTINNANSLSLNSFPNVHSTKESAITEATRLLQSGTIPAGREVVLLEVKNFIRLNAQPIVIT